MKSMKSTESALSESLEVSTDDTITQFQLLTEGLFRYETRYDQSKGQRSGQSSREVTVSGPMWNLVLSEGGEGEVQALTGSQAQPFELCPSAVFIPPFSMIEFQFSNLRCHYSGYLGCSDLPPDLPKAPVPFAIDGMPEINCADDVIQFIRHAEVKTSLDRSDRPDQTALAAREFLNSRYEENPSIGKVAEYLGVAHHSLTKSFKKAYGLSPVQYLNNLRVQDSLRHMLFGRASVSSTAFQVGFGDLSRFNKNFKKVMEAVPSQFVFRSHR